MRGSTGLLSKCSPKQQLCEAQAGKPELKAARRSKYYTGLAASLFAAPGANMQRTTRMFAIMQRKIELGRDMGKGSGIPGARSKAPSLGLPAARSKAAGSSAAGAAGSSAAGPPAAAMAKRAGKGEKGYRTHEEWSSSHLRRAGVLEIPDPSWFRP